MGTGSWWVQREIICIYDTTKLTNMPVDDAERDCCNKDKD